MIRAIVTTSCYPKPHPVKAPEQWEGWLHCIIMATDTSQDQLLFPSIEPFDSGYLKVSELHSLYYEQCGKPNGKPVIFV